MNKLMTVVAASVCAVSLSGTAVAAEDVSKDEAQKVTADEAEALEEDEAKIFEAGFDFDFFSAYVWRNAIQTDEMVMQPCVWADLTYFEPFWLGFYVWQNYDLTDRRHNDLRKGLTETDYNVHVGATVWSSDDEDQELGIELGHEWFDNNFVRSGSGNAYPDTREIYVKLTYDNPFVNVYGQASWLYEDFGDYKQGVHYELGFNKEIDLAEVIDIPEETLKLGADWNVSFGTGHYLNYLYGGTRSGVDEDGEMQYDGSSAGFGGTTVKVYLTWQITENLSLGGTIAYTGVLNGAYREAIGDQGDDWWDYDEEAGRGNGFYQRDFVWGGVSLKFAF